MFYDCVDLTIYINIKCTNDMHCNIIISVVGTSILIWLVILVGKHLVKTMKSKE